MDKEMININAKLLKEPAFGTFTRGGFIHVSGYFNKRTKHGKTYKNFVVMSMKKIEKKEEDEGQ